MEHWQLEDKPASDQHPAQTNRRIDARRSQPRSITKEVDGRRSRLYRDAVKHSMDGQCTMDRKTLPTSRAAGDPIPILIREARSEDAPALIGYFRRLFRRTGDHHHQSR